MRLPMIAALLLGLSFISTVTVAQGDKKSTAIAESWIGHDASELLTQWPVDSGFVMREQSENNETAYFYTFGVDAHTRTYSVSDGQQAMGTDANGQVVVANQSHTEQEYVPATVNCEISFYANAQGIITRYDYRGRTCRIDFSHWGRPKTNG